MSRYWLSRRARLGLIALLLTTVLAIPLPTLAASTATVTDRLNLRSGPGLGYQVITVMPAGATVTLAGEPTEGWYPVHYDELSGWAYGAYLALGGAPVGAPASTTAQGVATVVTSLLNLRSGPGLTYAVIGQLTYGTTVRITDGPKAVDGRTWLGVVAERIGSGWVAAAYLDAGEGGGAAAAITPPPAPVSTPAPASSGNTIIDIITEAANRYGQSPAAMIAVARCESGLNPNDVNRSSGASGLFQFLPGTWRTTPYASYSIFDAWANANAAAWMWSVGRRGEWVC